MTAFVVVATVLGLVVLVACLVLLARVQRRLARLETHLAEQPVGLSLDDAILVAESAAHEAAAAVHRAPLPPALMAGGAQGGADSPVRRSPTRIKASGWAAGASETMRRLRQGA